MTKLNLIPTVPQEILPPKLSRIILNENSFYTRPNFALVNETVTSDGVSVNVNFFDINLTNTTELSTNLVLNIDDISSQFTGITSEFYGDSVLGISTFSLLNNSNPLLMSKVVDTSITSPSSQDLQISKSNHDFSTGEELNYEYETTPINIESVSIPGIGVTTILPSTVYAIRESVGSFKISGTKDNSLSGIALTFSSVGSGTTHYFYSKNVNSRSIIIIDGIIQEPIYRKNESVGFGTTSVGISTNIIPISGISSLSISDFLLSNGEYIKITGISTSDSTVLVNRGSMGTVAVAHTSGDPVKVYSGSYNIVKDKIHFSSPPLNESSFNGRIFYKKLYDKNIIFDDISKEFVGLGKTFTIKSEFSNVGLVTSNTTGFQYGILLINNIFQRPGIDYNLSGTTGITTITFTGTTEEDLPKSGKILEYEYTPGSGYQSLVAAAATVSVNGLGEIDNVYLNGTGSGYLTSPQVYVYSSVGSGATITALVGTGSSVGFITGFTIDNPGVGYTTTDLPNIAIDEPYGYSNLNLVYSSGSGTGYNAKIDLVVGVGGSVTSLDLNNVGIGYSVGDTLTVSGIGTVVGYNPFTLTVKKIQNDSFNFWTFGKLLRIKIDETPNGFAKNFKLLNFENDLPIDFTTNSSDIRFQIEKNVLVFINDVLQLTDTYKVNGSNLIFFDPPPENSKLYVYVYVASDEDSFESIAKETIKVGDSIRIRDQNDRSVTEILSNISVRTPNYIGQGINSNLDNLRSVDWTKQTRDLVIRGINFYKSRNSYSSQVKPTSRLTVGVGSTSEAIYVENSYLFDSDGIVESETSVSLINDIPLLTAKAESTVSFGGTVSSIIITDGGAGYVQSNPPSVTISNREILKETVWKNWNLVDSDNSTIYNRSFSEGSRTVSVGQSLSIRSSYNLIDFDYSTVALGSTSLNSIVYGDNIWIVAGDNGFISTSTNLTSWNNVGFATVVGGSLPEQISPISFSENINDITHSDGRFVAVSNNGEILTYESSDPVLMSRYGNNFIQRDTGTANNLNSIIVDQIFDVGEGITKTQYVSVGNSSTILVSSNSIDNELIGTPGIVWQIRMSETISPTGLSGEKLNSITHTGISTIPFIVVGDNGLVIKFPNNKFNPSDFTIITPFTSENLNSVFYDEINERALVVGASGTSYASYKSSSFNVWEPISIGSTNLNHIVYSNSDREYLVVGDGKTYTSRYEKVGAAATAIVSAGGTISAIVISDGGLFYDTLPTNNPDVIISSPPIIIERFDSCKVKGDYGKIVGITTTNGISTTSPAISFELEVDSVLSMVESEIETGDYFVTYQTNIGSGMTSILSNGSIVGVATTFIDCVYRADQVTKSATGIVTVVSNVSSVSGILTIPSLYQYGIYSWGKVYDFNARKSPQIFNANVLNGSSGLSTSPKLVRITSVGSTTLPRNA